MSFAKPAIDTRRQRTSRTRLARFSLIALLALLLSVTACGGLSDQSRDSRPATRTGTVADYDKMVKEYDQQAGPPDEGFWNEVYQDAK